MPILETQKEKMIMTILHQYTKVTDPHTEYEVENMIQRTEDNKAPGDDNGVSELCKCGEITQVGSVQVNNQNIGE